MSTFMKKKELGSDEMIAAAKDDSAYHTVQRNNSF